MKHFYLALLMATLLSPAFGQSNFYLLGIGVSGGATYTFSDVEKGSFSYAAAATLDYNITPFISAGLELQTGTLKGGNYMLDPHKREFANGYKAVILNTKVRAGQFTDFYYNDFLNYTKGAYIGTGIGVIQNKMTKIVRQKIEQDGSVYTFPGLDKGNSAVVPLNIGIDFFFPDGWGDMRYVFNVNYQTTLVLDDNMDGYNDPKISFANKASDIYNFFSVGVKYTFGPKGLSAKNFR